MIEVMLTKSVYKGIFRAVRDKTQRVPSRNQSMNHFRGSWYEFGAKSGSTGVFLLCRLINNRVAAIEKDRVF